MASGGRDCYASRGAGVLGSLSTLMTATSSRSYCGASGRRLPSLLKIRAKSYLGPVLKAAGANEGRLDARLYQASSLSIESETYLRKESLPTAWPKMLSAYVARLSE